MQKGHQWPRKSGCVLALVGFCLKDFCRGDREGERSEVWRERKRVADVQTTSTKL